MPAERIISMPTAWAEDAQITIPSPPFANTAYRDVGLTAAQIAAGQGYASLLDSSEYNEFLYRVSTMLQLLEQNGILPWSQKTDYVTGAWAMGTDGVVYKAAQPSGPNNGGFKAPPDIGYWDTAAIRIATDAESTAGVLETVAVNPKQLAVVDDKLTDMQNHLIVRPVHVAIQESGLALNWKTPVDLSAHLPEGAVLFGGYAHMRTTQAGQSTLAVGTDWIDYSEICSTNNLFATAGHFVLATNNQKMYVGNPVVVGGVTEQTIIIKWYASLF